MSDIRIECYPKTGILTVSAETVSALDALGQTLPDSTPWEINVAIGRTIRDTIRLTAHPHEPEDEAA